MEKIINEALERGILQKLIFSGSRDAASVRTTAKPVTLKGEVYLQFETMQSDNKAIHKNVPTAEAAEYASALAASYRHINILTTAGNCEVLISKKGKRTVIGKLGKEGEAVTAAAHDRGKSHILPDGEPCAFLEKLGVCDAKGHIFDKKRAKYRQINRFLEIVRDVKDVLPENAKVLDLCCGKSYLSFALYWYLTEKCAKTPQMLGIDLKADVIEYCNEVSREVGFDGLAFKAGDILEYEMSEAPDLVVSLHACDIATDIVLAKAVKSGAKLILSSPCCHHEMMHQLSGGEGIVGIIGGYSMLKQKFCDAATDALRSKLLEACGYKVDVIEFIDPDETPKNLLIRAVYMGKPDPKAKEEYISACRELDVHPKLAELLGIKI